MLDQRRKRCANIKKALSQCLVFNRTGQVYFARVCVLFRGKRGAVCGKRLTFLYTTPLNKSNVTSQVLRLRRPTFVFKKCSEIILFTILFVVKSLKGCGWNNVGPASQTVAQHYISFGTMYRVIWCAGAGNLKVTSIMRQSEKTVQSPNAVSMTGQRRRLWANIEIVLIECHLFAQSMQHTQ